jgi:acyl carrier protein
LPGPLLESAQGVLEEVRDLLVDVIGEEYLLDVEVSPATSFHDDLEIESIEFVALAEKLLERYGEQVDFVGWLAEKELDEILAMTVGDLVDYIVSSTSGAGTSGAGTSDAGGAGQDA